MSLFKRYIPEDIDEASARFYALNPLEVPSGLLSEGHLERISELPVYEPSIGEGQRASFFPRH